MKKGHHPSFLIFTSSIIACKALSTWCTFYLISRRGSCPKKRKAQPRRRKVFYLDFLCLLWKKVLCLFCICTLIFRIFGKVYPLPRQQVAYGDPGITYKYSGTTVPALPWTPPVLSLRDFLFKLKGIKYDFVLINK